MHDARRRLLKSLHLGYARPDLPLHGRPVRVPVARRALLIAAVGPFVRRGATAAKAFALVPVSHSAASTTTWEEPDQCWT